MTYNVFGGTLNLAQSWHSVNLYLQPTATLYYFVICGSNYFSRDSDIPLQLFELVTCIVTVQDTVQQQHISTAMTASVPCFKVIEMSK